MDYIKKIIDMIQGFVVKKFTGVVTITIFFNEGGIRDAKKNIEDKI
jgi:hypothetical protein